ncbi:MAG: UbiX family flavin prenyltransferase [Planctomycetota bacterium]|nr:MAG: UbiX family flavin prenyltransferase [Planctomycetota bacterium]
MSAPQRRLFLGVTGASGARYALRTLQMLVEAGVHVDLCYSPAGCRVLHEECGLAFDGAPAALLRPGQDQARVRLHQHSDIGAPPASGTALGEGAVIVPCSLTTLSGIAGGRAGNLIERAAQVALKEQKKLVLVPRETPLSRLHLDLLSRLAWAGAVILPAAPGFYHRPQSIDDLVDHVCAKILNVLGVPQSCVAPWDGGEESA